MSVSSVGANSLYENWLQQIQQSAVNNGATQSLTSLASTQTTSAASNSFSSSQALSANGELQANQSSPGTATSGSAAARPHHGHHHHAAASSDSSDSSTTGASTSETFSALAAQNDVLSQLGQDS